MSLIPLPSASELAVVLTDLVGRDVAVSGDKALDVSSDEVVVASYLDDEGVLCGMLAADEFGAAYLAGAMVMIPAAGIEGLDENLTEIFGEVANVVSGSLNSAHTPHLVFRGLVDGGAKLPGEHHGLLDAAATVAGFAVSVAGYGTGRLTFVIR